MSIDIHILSSAMLAQTIFDLGDIILLCMLPLLLLLSGFFSGTETALFSLTARQRLEINKTGGILSKTVNALMFNPRMLLITLMTGNMLINVSYFVLSSALVLKVEKANLNVQMMSFDLSLIIVTLAGLTPLIMIVIFGEVLQKMIANTAPILWARVMGIPMLMVHQVCFPIRWFVGHGIITPTARLIAPSEDAPEVSAEEFREMLRQSKSRGEIDDGEEQILREVVSLHEIKVREVMVPRVDMHAVNIETEPQELFNLIMEIKLTKFPVYEENIDHIIGLMYARDFLLARMENPNVNLRELIRRVTFVPEIQRLDQLLEQFRSSGRQQAIVVDEYGGTAGLITLKDIAERMMGDLDMDDAPGEAGDEIVDQVAKNVWRVSGRLNARDWANAMGLEELPHNATTVGGLMMALLNRTPQHGDLARIANIELMIEKMNGLRIESVVLRLLSHQEVWEAEAREQADAENTTSHLKSMSVLADEEQLRLEEADEQTGDETP